jgi:hypothetical protein
MVGRRRDMEAGVAGRRPEIYRRFLAEVVGDVRLGDELGFYGYCEPEHPARVADRGQRSRTSRCVHHQVAPRFATRGAQGVFI